LLSAICLYVCAFPLSLLVYIMRSPCCLSVSPTPNFIVFYAVRVLSKERRRLVFSQNFMFYVGFEVFTAVVMKSTIFWDMTLCSPLSCNRRFGGTYRLHLQGRRIISARTSRQAGSKQAIGSSETLVATQRTTRRHIPEDNALHVLYLIHSWIT
jgi:hypothetical protein